MGDVAVGGGAPITVQSMTTTRTADVEGTLQQIYALAAAGADIVRCTCNEIEAAEGLAQIVPRSPVPIVADIHHQYRMALAALDAGVQCLRLNPGNIRKPEHIQAVASECRDRGVPIRIGVNGGSLHPDLYRKYNDRVTPEAMVESAQMELDYFADVGFDDVKISVKASSVPLMIEAYRQLAEVTNVNCAHAVCQTVRRRLEGRVHLHHRRAVGVFFHGRFRSCGGHGRNWRGCGRGGRSRRCRGRLRFCGATAGQDEGEKSQQGSQK